MTILAAEDDPFLLPLPTAETAVVQPEWISAGNAHANCRYKDLDWSLAPLIDNPATPLARVHWTRCPEDLREQLKLAAWTMINGQLRPTHLQKRGPTARARTSATEMRGTCNEWIRLARWLHERGITDLGACTDAHWRAYIARRWTVGLSRNRAERICSASINLWAFDQLSAKPSGIARPPWDVEGVDDFLPGADGTARHENSTEPLDPQVIGPLLIWAIRFVDDFADDILAGWAEYRRLTDRVAGLTASAEGHAALEQLLLPRIRAGDSIPAVPLPGRFGAARIYLSALSGASLGQFDKFGKKHRLSELAAQRPGPCPMQVPVTGRIEGRPWRPHMDFREIAELMRHLGTAAAIVCLYLTGMRPQEVQALRSGCCPAPEATEDGTTGRHLIRGHHFKSVVDDDGNHISAGELRTVPWVAITPVVHAIRVLEQMVPPGELLLSATHHDSYYRHGHPGALKGQGLKKRINDFTVWANREARAWKLLEQAIPEDPHGAITLARFRRTLAWHIARRPGGLVALAIQYGHMRTMLDARTSSGYASRSHRGIHSVLDVETALAAADTAARLRDRVASGEKVSGPASSRALAAAVQTPRFEGRLISRSFARKATAFLARDGIVLYDNPDAFLICAFKRENALCNPEPEATSPRQYDCRPGCGNTVRTDTHARQMRDQAAEAELLAVRAPAPVAKRLQARADSLRAAAEAHDSTAQTPRP